MVPSLPTNDVSGPRTRPWLRHYDPGVPPSISYPDHPLQTFLQQSAYKYPERACTVLDDTRVSYRQMDALTDQIAHGLAGAGVHKGDRVGIFMPNVPEFIMAFYGILKAGAVVVATNPLYTPGEIAHQLDDSGTRLIFCTSATYETLKEGLPTPSTARIIVASSGAEPLGPLRGQDLPFSVLIEGTDLNSGVDVIPGAEDVALFQYSGGTTGTSKAAVATHRGVVANTIQFRRWLVTLEEGAETVLMAIPLYHAYGMIAGMSLGIAIGATLALVSNPRDMPAMLKVIADHQPTVFPGVPTLYSALCNNADVTTGRVNLRSLRVCISGSTALMPETKERFERLSSGQICEGYGLSEAPVVTHCNPLLGQNKIGSIGMPMPDVDCRVVNPDEPDVDVPAGQPGELLLRGPQLMREYHNMPRETALALRKLQDDAMWLFTGDIVRMDEDGYFYVVDRKKELIKPGGFQVWPREVEEAIASHPQVLEVGVAGIRDAEGGEVVKAWIVLRPGSRVSEASIRDWCKARLAPYKVPGMIAFRVALPKSNVGKVLRRELIREHQLKTGSEHRPE